MSKPTGKKEDEDEVWKHADPDDEEEETKEEVPQETDDTFEP